MTSIFGSSSNITIVDGIQNPLSTTLDANNNKIINLPEPTALQEAATKNYVDTNAGGGGGVQNPMVVTLDANDNDIDNVSRLSLLEIQSADIGAIQSFSELSMGDNKITNLLDPLNVQDAATKNYVDDSVTGLVQNPLTADLFGGNGNLLDFNGLDVQSITNLGGTTILFDTNLNINTKKIVNLAPPTDPQDAATKAYVDANSGGGGVSNPLTTDLDGGGFKITNLVNPTVTGDAANKAYVDSKAVNQDNIAGQTILPVNVCNGYAPGSTTIYFFQFTADTRYYLFLLDLYKSRSSSGIIHAAIYSGDLSDLANTTFKLGSSTTTTTGQTCFTLSLGNAIPVVKSECLILAIQSPSVNLLARTDCLNNSDFAFTTPQTGTIGNGNWPSTLNGISGSTTGIRIASAVHSV